MTMTPVERQAFAERYLSWDSAVSDRACDPALLWMDVINERDVAELWKVCERPDWMLWALARHPDAAQYREAIIQFAREMAWRAAMHWAAAEAADEATAAEAAWEAAWEAAEAAWEAAWEAAAAAAAEAAAAAREHSTNAARLRELIPNPWRGDDEA